MKIELNKTYKTRSGHFVKIIDVDYSYSKPFFGHITDSKGNKIRPAAFSESGMMYHYKQSDHDLLEEVDITQTIEICYRNMNGSISVHYRRDKGSKDAEELINEVEAIKKREGDKCRYFIRIV